MAAISLRNVVKRYGKGRQELQVIHGIDAEIADREFVVIVGPSGCGKSTLLRMVAGLEEISGGEIAIGGRVVNELEPAERDIAMVFQNYALYPHMSVYDNIAFGLKLRSVPKPEIERRVNEVAEMLSIGQLLKRKPKELSGGQRQRVAVGRAIAREPAVFLMDEPLSNLDARLRVQMRGELKRLQHQLGTTTIYVTHDQAEAMTLAHRVAVMQKGKLQQFDTPMNIYERPANRFVAEFVGSPSMNFVKGEISGACFESRDITIELTDKQLSSLTTTQVILGVRPEHVRIDKVQKNGAIPATVYVTESMGNETFVFLTVGENRLIARAPAEFRAELESKVWLSLATEKLHFFDQETEARIGE